MGQRRERMKKLPFAEAEEDMVSCMTIPTTRGGTPRDLASSRPVTDTQNLSKAVWPSNISNDDRRQYSSRYPAMVSPSHHPNSIESAVSKGRFASLEGQNRLRGAVPLPVTPGIRNIIIQYDHSPASVDPLLCLIFSLSPVQERLLSEGLQPQKRWNSEGKVRELTLRDVIYDTLLANLYSRT